MIHVIAAIEVHVGKRDVLLEEFKRIAQTVREEQGCVEYGTAIDAHTGMDIQVAPRENVVTVVEKWDDIDALKAHLAAPHMVEFRTRVKDVVTNISLQILDPA
jgi:quinol monooxygenase YgiN